MIDTGKLDKKLAEMCDEDIHVRSVIIYRVMIGDISCQGLVDFATFGMVKPYGAYEIMHWVRTEIQRLMWEGILIEKDGLISINEEYA